MMVSPENQGRVFLINILTGFLCVLLFDLFRSIRKRFAKSRRGVNFIDIIYSVIVFLLILYTGIKYNFGALRYYQIAGILTGVCMGGIKSSERRYMVEKTYAVCEKIITTALKVTGKAIVVILQLIISPVMYIEEKLIKSGEKISKFHKKVIKKRKKAKKTVKKRIKMI